jgi:hypothetical protein
MDKEPKHGEWIDINDQFPHFNVNRNVIVYMPMAYISVGVETVYNDGNGKSCFSKGWNKGDGQHEVTHWMPLPEPPKKSPN